MKRYRDQDIVDPGWYFNPRHVAFRSVSERQPLEGRQGEDYYRVPILVTILVAPFVGLAYFIFLPVIGFVMLGSLLARKLAVVVKSAAASATRVLTPSWQPARAFLTTSKAGTAPRGSRDKWAERTARELGLEAGPTERHVHVSGAVTIHAPLEETYELVEDRARWNDWFVGMSEPRRLEGLRLHNRHPSVLVGTHFPLVEQGSKDCRERDAAHWHSPGPERAETGTLGLGGLLVFLPTEQHWEYNRHDGATEVEVEWDVRIPDEGWMRALDDETVRELESECLERTLRNLKSVCEGETIH